MSENRQKLKLVRLLDLLKNETDEEHPLTTIELCDRLAAQGIPCDRRTISRDITLINDEVLEVMVVMHGHEKAYYVEDRTFSRPELRVLIDAIHAAGFIPEDLSKDIADKLADMAGRHGAEKLRRSAARFTAFKHSNRSVFYAINDLQDAIAQEKQVSFLYFDLDEDLKRVYRGNREVYVAEPLTLVFREDRYYLVAYTVKHGGLTSFRIDRMENVSILEDGRSAAAIAASRELSGFIERTFQMFGGTPEEVDLLFEKPLLGAVYDHFGEDVRVRRRANGLCETRVPVNVSPTFFGWVAQFGGKMRIAAPMPVADAYSAHLMAAAKAQTMPWGKIEES